MKSGRRLTLLTLVTIIAGSVAVADIPTGEVSVNTSAKGEVRRWEVSGPWGGDVRVLVGAPDDPDRLYLGTSDGQMFRSTDGSASWRRLRPGIERRGLSVDSIVIDPRNPRTIYVGAWAVSHNPEKEGGVFKSEDGGENWKLLEGTVGEVVLSVAIAPSDSRFLIIGTKSGVFRSRDAGANWQRISPEGDREIRNVGSVAVHPTNTDIIYIGTHHLPWRTVDGGISWKQTGYQAVGMIDDTDIMGICINPENPDIVYMNGCSGIYRSSTAGDKWFKIPGIPFSARRTYALLLHPEKPNIIFAGTSEGLWRSRDGGKRWALLTSKNVVIRSIVIHAAKPDRLLIGTDDFGVRISDNLGDSFEDANLGFIHRHILAILPDATERGRILASLFHDGAAGSVFLSLDGGDTWHPSSRGLGTRDVFTFYQMPDEPDIIYAGTNSGVFKSIDRGESWSFVGIVKPPPVRRPVRRRAPRRRAQAAPAILNNQTYEVLAVSQQRRRTPARPPARPAPKPPEPTGPPLIELTKQVDDITSYVDGEGRRGLMAATLDGLYRTLDETKGWELVTIGEGESVGRVFSVSTHPTAPDKIFAGTRRGLYVSRDGGASWEGTQRGPDSEHSVKAIAQDPRDPMLVIVGTNHSLFRSTDGGRNWVRRGGGLTYGDFTAVVFNPASPDELLVADYSRGGVYRSKDSGYTWERIDTELPTSRVWTIAFDPLERGRVYAGSFSSGVYVLTVQRGVASSQD